MAGDIATVIAFMRAYPGEENQRWLFAQALVDMDLELSLDSGKILPNQRTNFIRGLFLGAFEKAMNEQVRRPFQVDALSSEKDVFIAVQLSEGVLKVTAPRKRLFSSTTYIFILWMLGTSMVLVGVAVIFMRNQVRSVRRLAVAADRFGRGQEVEHFKLEGAAEVRQAAHAFNIMRERIRRQIAQRTEMLAGVSHDLRTPLTRMKLQLAMMGTAEGCEELNEDVAEMERMVEGYLAFARGEGAEDTQPTDCAALLEDIVRRFRRNGAAITLHAEKSATLPLRPHAMERGLTNLIGNAVRYAGHVAVRAGERPEGFEILIDDDGPGIPAENREDVFKAFFRLDSSRNQETGGVGLGLTIARDVIRSHGGDIHLEDSPLGGLRVRLTLPQ